MIIVSYTVPSRDSTPAQHSSDSDTALAALPGIAAQANALETNVNTRTASALTFYNNATASYNYSITYAALAANYASSVVWVTGTTYAIGNYRWSPDTGRGFVRKTVGAGSTDPASDRVNWHNLPSTLPMIYQYDLQVTCAAGARLCLVGQVQQAATNLFTYSDKLWDGAYWNVIGYFAVSEYTGLILPEGRAGSCTRYIANFTGGLFVRKILTVAAETYSAQVWVYVPTQSGTTSWNFYGIFAGVENAKSPDYTLFDCWVLASVTIPVAASRAYMDMYIGRNGVAGVVPAGFTFYATHAQLEVGLVPSSFIATTSVAVTRLAGAVSPVAVVLPLPQEGDVVTVKVANGVTTNTVDPRGSSIEDSFGVLRLDQKNLCLTFHYHNASWRIR